MKNVIIAGALTLSIFALIAILVLGTYYVPIITFVMTVAVCAVILFSVFYYTLKNKK